MVDPVQSQGVLQSLLVNAEGRAAAGVQKVSTIAQRILGAGNPVEAVQTGELSKEIASKPPVDMDRVKALRDAIQSGNFPVRPQAIAEAMIRSL